ncbi:protein of unknown function [Rhodospirillales bacterium URHD0017]|nr:protein of unknown function [Rhodospirillales bacterium URHD0017]
MKQRGGLAFLLAAAAALLTASPAAAQLQSHRAEYTLRLGTALNATRIGAIVQDIERTCDGWRLRRELVVDASLTPSFKVSFTSRLEGDEPPGKAFTWRAVQILNGAEREVRGSVEKRDGAWQVDRTTPDGPLPSVLPSFTHMPVAAVDWLLRRLAAGSDSFPLLMFVPEAEGGAFLLDVKRAASGGADTTPPSQRRVEVPARQSWPFTIAVTRAGRTDGKPIVILRGRLYESGVMDGVVADAGVITVAAHLRALQMREPPACPASR